MQLNIIKNKIEKIKYLKNSFHQNQSVLMEQVINVAFVQSFSNGTFFSDFFKMKPGTGFRSYEDTNAIMEKNGKVIQIELEDNVWYTYEELLNNF